MTTWGKVVNEIVNSYVGKKKFYSCFYEQGKNRYFWQ